MKVFFQNVKIKFKWFDIWIGIFIDTKNRKIYICPLPMVVIVINIIYLKFLWKLLRTRIKQFIKGVIK